MTSLRLTDEERLGHGVTERGIDLDGVPGLVWTPSATAAGTPLPLVLLGHPGGIVRVRDRLRSRAAQAARQGFASATNELPGSGDRVAMPGVDAARAAVRRAAAGGMLPGEDVIDQLVLPLVEAAVPEWRALLDELLRLPELGGPVALTGGLTAVGVRMARVEPRLRALGLFAGSFLPRSVLEEARDVRVPVHVLLQWDDEGNDRQRALELFDALGSRQKTLQANLGGHTGVPTHAAQDVARFLARHLA